MLLLLLLLLTPTLLLLIMLWMRLPPARVVLGSSSFLRHGCSDGCRLAAVTEEPCRCAGRSSTGRHHASRHRLHPVPHAAACRRWLPRAQWRQRPPPLHPFLMPPTATVVTAALAADLHATASAAGARSVVTAATATVASPRAATMAAADAATAGERQYALKQQSGWRHRYE